MSSVLYPYWMNAKLPCGDCAACCETNASKVTCSDREYETIRAFCMERGIRYEPLGETACGFLGKDKRCNIYEVRPYLCRAFGASEELPCHRLPSTNLVSYPLEQVRQEGFTGVIALHRLTEELDANAARNEEAGSTQVLDTRELETAGATKN